MWYYKLADFNFDKRKKIYDFFFSYRINPVELNRFGKLFPPFADWDYLVKKGAKAICVNTYRQEDDSLNFKRFDSTFRAETKLLKNNPLKKYAFIFAFDEANINYHYQEIE